MTDNQKCEYSVVIEIDHKGEKQFVVFDFDTKPSRAAWEDIFEQVYSKVK